MGQVFKVMYTTTKIDVNCERNDWEDIKCGGSPILGYTFYIDSDEDPDEYIEFIKKTMTELGRKKLMGINKSKGIEVEKVWTKEMIKKCIKDYTFDY